ncbi:MAG: GGDEF domain-containing protein [Candidatus Kerfeldbacteria bacterium]|nr:GGDEF domain-containing protein [Candidatus Kerfeldbacteria bacterium]
MDNVILQRKKERPLRFGRPPVLAERYSVRARSEDRKLPTKANLVENLRVRCVELREQLHDTRDVSLVPGILMRQLIVEYADYFEPSEIREVIIYIGQLEKLAGVDPLTQALNRNMFDRDLARVWTQLDREKHERVEDKGTVIAIVDIDFFKRVNTRGGLPAGDIALQEVVKLMKHVFRRATDDMYRYGGEEFALILRNTNAEHASLLLENFRELVQRNLADRVLARMPEGIEKTQLRNVPVTVSIGFASRADQKNPILWFDQADAALYSVKRNGRNAVERFVDGMEMNPQVASQQRRDTRAQGPVIDDISIQALLQHLPSIPQDDPHIYAEYTRRQDERQGQSAVLVHGDPREGMRSVLLRLAQRVAPAELFEKNTFQAIERSIFYIDQFAHIDALTLLPNTLALEIEKKRVWSEMQRQGHTYGLILMDIDFFKRINDTHGHSVGDLVLRAFGRVFKKFLRRNEFAARIGGEEFVVLVELNQQHNFPYVLERLRSVVEEEVMKVVMRMCADQGLSVQFDREAFTATIAGIVLAPTPEIVGSGTAQRTMYQVMPFDKAKTSVARALNYGKGFPGTEDPAHVPGYQTSRSGSEGRNRWVIAT